ncbi:MAG: type IV pilin protein [Eubacteriales bacterium]
MFGKLRNEKGFTMVEMMVVLIIIAVLIAGGIKFYLGYIENSRVTKAKANIGNMQAALDSFYSEEGKYDLTTDGLAYAGITTDSKDPWGKDYKFIWITTDTSYEIRSGFDNVHGKGYVVYGIGTDGKSTPPEIGSR